MTEAVGQVGLGLGKAHKIFEEAFFGNMKGKDVTNNDEVHGGGAVGMDNQVK